MTPRMSVAMLPTAIAAMVSGEASATTTSSLVGSAKYMITMMRMYM